MAMTSAPAPAATSLRHLAPEVASKHGEGKRRHDEHKPRQRSRVAEVEELERDAVQVDAEELRRGPGPPAREDKDVVEDPKRVREPKDQHEEQQRRQVREFNVAEEAPAGGAVAPGGPA